MEVDGDSALRKLSLASPTGVVTSRNKLDRKIHARRPGAGLCNSLMASGRKLATSKPSLRRMVCTFNAEVMEEDSQ